MPRYATEAIILESRDFLESDKIVCVLSKEQGLITAIAKGAHRSKRRFPGTLEPFCEVVLEIFSRRGADLHRIESATLIHANLGIREDLALLGHAAVLMEVVKENLGLFDPAPATYECLREALSAMDGCRQWFENWSVSMLHILRSLGYGIDTKTLPRTHYRGISGVLEDTLSSEACMFLGKGMNLSQKVLSRVTVSQQARREIDSYLLRLCTHLCERPLKSVIFLAKLLDLNLNEC